MYQIERNIIRVEDLSNKDEISISLFIKYNINIFN